MNQKVKLAAYRGGSKHVFENFENLSPDLHMQGTVTLAQDSPRIRLGGHERYFLPFHKAPTGTVLACIMDVEQQ